MKISKFFIIDFFHFYMRKVTYEQGKEIKEKNKFDLFMETSAKNGLNVKELFFEAGKLLYKKTLEENKVNKVRKNKFSFNT